MPYSLPLPVAPTLSSTVPDDRSVLLVILEATGDNNLGAKRPVPVTLLDLVPRK